MRCSRHSISEPYRFNSGTLKGGDIAETIRVRPQCLHVREEFEGAFLDQGRIKEGTSKGDKLIRFLRLLSRNTLIS
jgi:hypothetical protein